MFHDIDDNGSDMDSEVQETDERLTTPGDNGTPIMPDSNEDDPSRQEQQNDPRSSECTGSTMSFSEFASPMDDGNFLTELVEEDSKEERLGVIYGAPDHDLELWHKQSGDDTCAVVSQEFILESMLGREFTEDELVAIAEEEGYYFPGSGTSPDNVGRMLEYYDINVERSEFNTVDNLIEKLQNNKKIIVGLDANEIWANSEFEQLKDLFDMPEANHAVQVIGYDDVSKTVILNDPGHPNGCGMKVSLDDFDQAWQDSNRFMVCTIEAAPSIETA